MRHVLADTIEVRLEIEQIKNRLAKQDIKLTNHDKNIELVFHYLDELVEKTERSKPIQNIGFKL